MINTQEIINNYIRRKQEEREKKEQTTWHISKLGSCLRGQYFERLGKKPDKEFTDRELRVFSMGNLIEDWYIDRLEEEDLKVETQVRVEDKKLNLSGYVDAVVSKNGTTEALEVKSKNSRAFTYMVERGGGAMRQHEYQLWTYLFLLGIDKGKICYISKDDLRMVEFVVRREDETLKKEVMETIDKLNEAWKKKNPFLLDLPDDKDWLAKYCRFHSYCKRSEK